MNWRTCQKVGDAVVGRVVGSWAEEVKSHEGRYKYHLCVCSETNADLFICSTQFDGDVPLPPHEFKRDREQESFISLRTVLYPKFRKNARVYGEVSVDYLTILRNHVELSEVMTEIEKKTVVRGIDRRLETE